MKTTRSRLQVLYDQLVEDEKQKELLEQQKLENQRKDRLNFFSNVLDKVFGEYLAVLAEDGFGVEVTLQTPHSPGTSDAYVNLTKSGKKFRFELSSSGNYRFNDNYTFGRWDFSCLIKILAEKDMIGPVKESGAVPKESLNVGLSDHCKGYTFVSDTTANILNFLLSEGWQLIKFGFNGGNSIYMDSLGGLIFTSEDRLIDSFPPTQDNFIFHALDKAKEYEQAREKT